MSGVLVDSNVILDVFLDDPQWADWSESTLEKYSHTATLYINAVVYSEISMAFKQIEDLELAIHNAGFQMIQIPKEALFLTGKAFLKYRGHKDAKRSPLPDFYIGAHAAVFDLELMTRDVGRYRTYFPTVKLITP